jgi:RNA polymerase sigma factor (sigma-70 family)
MNSAAAREQQATDCLEAAERHRASLLAVACRYAGSEEGGMDLYQQTVLNCHDAVQRNGFAGGRYEFYLLTSIKNLHYKESKKKQQTVALSVELEPADVCEPPCDAHAQLAEQVAAEVRERFDGNERVILRLHADGYSFQTIAEMLGVSDRWRVRRQLDRLKGILRSTFQQAWDALGN